MIHTFGKRFIDKSVQKATGKPMQLIVRALNCCFANYVDAESSSDDDRSSPGSDKSRDGRRGSVGFCQRETQTSQRYLAGALN